MDNGELPRRSLRVIDLTGDLGAMCGKVLADLGADVVLVEPPGGSPGGRSRRSSATRACRSPFVTRTNAA